MDFFRPGAVRHKADGMRRLACVIVDGDEADKMRECDISMFNYILLKVK